jgi:hypothetical protein
MWYSITIMSDTIIRCGGCAQDLPETAFAVDKARSTGRRYRCRACSAAEFKRWQQTDGYQTRLAKGRTVRGQLKQTDPKRRWAEMALNNARRRAKAKGLSCTVTVDWLVSASPDTCPALGIPLSYSNDRSLANSAAVDRIDNARGYDPDNCWVISMKANRIKSNAELSEIEAVAGALRRLIDNLAADGVQAATAPVKD